MIGVNAPASNTSPATTGKAIETRDLPTRQRSPLTRELELLAGVSPDFLR
jgi:hypothetical protein